LNAKYTQFKSDAYQNDLRCAGVSNLQPDVVVPPVTPPPPPSPPPSSNEVQSYVKSDLIVSKGSLLYLIPIKDPADRDKYEERAIKTNPIDVLNSLASDNELASR
jgi:hypothetical protein